MHGNGVLGYMGSGEGPNRVSERDRCLSVEFGFCRLSCVVLQFVD